MTQLETTLTIHPNSPALAELSKPLKFIAYYTHFKEYAGVPTVTLTIELNSLYDLCDYAGAQYGYRFPLCIEDYARNLDRCAGFESFHSMPKIAEDDKGTDYLFLCKFCPKSYMDQFTSAEIGCDVLNSIVAAANTRPYPTARRHRLAYQTHHDNNEVRQVMQEVAATALGNAVVQFCLRVPEYEAYLNALEGDYMAGANRSFITETANSVREQMGSVFLDMPRMF